MFVIHICSSVYVVYLCSNCQLINKTENIYKKIERRPMDAVHVGPSELPRNRFCSRIIMLNLKAMSKHCLMCSKNDLDLTLVFYPNKRIQ